MKNDPFNVREYWVQLGEPEPQRTPVRGGFRHQRFHAGDFVRVPEPKLAGFPPPGLYTVAAVHCDPVDAPYPGSGVWSARYILEGCNVPAYDETLRRVP
jgi:hypothetical protein